MTLCAVQYPVYGWQSVPIWDASYSLPTEPLAGDFYCTVTADMGALGVIAGVSAPEVVAHYLDIRYGFHFSKGTADIVESGVFRGQPIASGSQWEYTISRVDGLVFYTRRDTLVTPARSEEHTSELQSR